MPKPKQDERFLDLAKRGAQAQLNDLLHEITMLLGLFPHLRDSFDKDELPISFLLKKGAQKGAPKSANPPAAEATAGAPIKKKRNLSPAARRAISNAQKRRWAAYNANKKAK